MIHENLGHCRLGLALGQLELRVLEIPDRAAEGLAALHIGNRLTDRAFDHADALQADDMALLRKFLHQLHEALARFLAKQVRGRHFHIIEEEL